METAADLQMRIAAARAQLQQRRDRQARAVEETDEAMERQRLRRELDEVNLEIAEVNADIGDQEDYTAAIDEDEAGDYLPDGERPRAADARAVRTQPSVNPCLRRDSISCSTGVATGELEWTVEGMSWLKAALGMGGHPQTAESARIEVGCHTFHLLYNPARPIVSCRVYDSKLSTFKSSLALQLTGEPGITFRYAFFVKRNDGEFVQWGETGEECFQSWRASNTNWKFGPDTELLQEGRAAEAPAVGIFGLSHEELLASEWVKDDALTVMVKVEVRTGGANRQLTAPASVEVPPSSLVADLLAQLDGADGSGDVAFFVGGERLHAHSQIICARSQVFSHMLRAPMREASSRDVTIEECDSLTFRALLRFLYTDDLECMDEWIKERAAEGGSPAAGAEVGGSSDALNRIALLQRLLSVGHRYQVERLRFWAEKKLAELVSIGTVCGCLCQAHLYEAKQLEAACLDFVSANHAKVSITPEFGALTVEWPAVMLKISHKLAGVQAAEAAPAVEAATAQGTKRKRHEL